MPEQRPPLRSVHLLVSCEHGGNRIPAPYRALFARSRRLLESHRGYDPGALSVARDFAAACHAELHYATVSRLLVELNRSRHHRQLFSAPVRKLPRAARDELLLRHYRPYRERLEASVAAAVRRGKQVVHLSCHSFAPALAGVRRAADVGLLFDPRRNPEAALCARWAALLRAADRRLVVRRNYPYRGSADGLTTYLRTRFDAQSYLGIELEVNQKYPAGSARRWNRLRRELVSTFRDACGYCACCSSDTLAR